MPRTSKREVQAVFERFAGVVGVPISTGFDSETRTMAPGWNLSYAPEYGGWTIVSYSGANTAQSMPFGSPPFDNGRMPAGEFVRAMHFAIRAVEASRSV